MEGKVHSTTVRSSQHRNGKRGVEDPIICTGVQEPGVRSTYRNVNT